MLHAHPQLVHLREVELDEVDAVVDLAGVVSLLELAGLRGVRQDVPGALQQVVPRQLDN